MNQYSPFERGCPKVTFKVTFGQPFCVALRKCRVLMLKSCFRARVTVCVFLVFALSDVWKYSLNKGKKKAVRDVIL